MRNPIRALQLCSALTLPHFWTCQYLRDVCDSAETGWQAKKNRCADQKKLKELHFQSIGSVKNSQSAIHGYETGCSSYSLSLASTLAGPPLNCSKARHVMPCVMSTRCSASSASYKTRCQWQNLPSHTDGRGTQAKVVALHLKQSRLEDQLCG